MREIIRERLIEERDILLFDILEELKKITLRANIETLPINVPYINTGTRPHIPSVTTTSMGDIEKFYACKYCGGLHEKSWQIAQCGKKNKKKEG